MTNIKFIIFFLISAQVSAGQLDQHSSVKEMQAQVSESLAAYADREDECMKSKKELSAKALREIGLSKSELKEALQYHYLRNLIECSKDQADKLIVDLQVLSLLAPQKDKEAAAASELILSDRVKLLKLKQNYFKISKIQRDLIESLSGVNDPIDLIATAKALGI